MGQTVDAPVIKKFKHRVHLCSNQDVIVDGKLEFQKKFIHEGWARIDRRRAQTFSQAGQTVFEEKDRRTHFIQMRYNANIEVTTSAWIYEHRLISPPRWFKILFVGDKDEDSRLWLFECRLMEAGDDVIVPTIGDHKQLGVPEGFSL